MPYHRGVSLSMSVFSEWRHIRSKSWTFPSPCSFCYVSRVVRESENGFSDLNWELPGGREGPEESDKREGGRIRRWKNHGGERHLQIRI